MHSAIANKIVAKLLAERCIHSLHGYAEVTQEVVLAQQLVAENKAARANKRTWVCAHCFFATLCCSVFCEHVSLSRLRGRQDNRSLSVQGIDLCSTSSPSSAPATKKQRLTSKLSRGKSASNAAKGPQTRCDFMLTGSDGSKTFVEVKSVTLAEKRAFYVSFWVPHVLMSSFRQTPADAHSGMS